MQVTLHYPRFADIKRKRNILKRNQNLTLTHNDMESVIQNLSSPLLLTKYFRKLKEGGKDCNSIRVTCELTVHHKTQFLKIIADNFHKIPTSFISSL